MLPQLEAPLRALREGRNEIWERVSAMPPAVRSAPLRNGAWSPLQQVEHIMLVEKTALAWIRSGREPGRRTLKGALLRLSLRVFFALGLRAKAPVPQVIPGEAPELEEIRRRWDETREDLAAYLEGVTRETLRQPVFRHPYVGALDLPETLRFLRLHQRHHQRQLAGSD